MYIFSRNSIPKQKTCRITLTVIPFLKLLSASMIIKQQGNALKLKSRHLTYGNGYIA